MAIDIGFGQQVTYDGAKHHSQYTQPADGPEKVQWNILEI